MSRIRRRCRPLERGAPGVWSDHDREMQALASRLTRRRFDLIQAGVDPLGVRAILRAEGLDEVHRWKDQRAEDWRGRTGRPSLAELQGAPGEPGGSR